MKEKAKKAFTDTAHITGTSFKKALKIAVPPQILNKSSVFGGLNRLGDAMVNFGTPTDTAQAKGKDYVIRHSGGAVADVAVGMLFFGVPVTMVTSFFSDGCQVASQVLKGAQTPDKEVTQMGEFFDDLSIVSNNFMKLFDIPSKGMAEDVHASIEHMVVSLRAQGRLSEPLKKDLEELDKLCCEDIKDEKEWSKKVHERLTRLAKNGLAQADLEIETTHIKNFIDEPSVENMKSMRDGLVKGFKGKGITVKSKSIQFVDKLVYSLETFESEGFSHNLRSLLIKQYQLANTTQDALHEASYYGYRIVYSLVNTTYKGASLFGGHYKNQIKQLMEKERLRRSQR